MMLLDQSSKSENRNFIQYRDRTGIRFPVRDMLDLLGKARTEGQFIRTPLSSRRENPDMSLFRNVLLACCSLLLWAGPISAAVLHVVGGSDVKPPDPGFVYNRSVFDCTPLLTLPLNIGLTGSLVDDTTGGTNLIDSYPCAPWQEMGPEHIYRLDVAAGDTLQFWAGLRDMDPDIDLDIFLLNGCDTDSCLIGANTELTADLTGGSYYLIIDGAGSGSNFAEGPYTLDITARYIGVPPEICDPGEPSRWIPARRNWSSPATCSARTT